MDSGKISTYLISLAGVVLAYVILNPSILQELMGNAYAQYGTVILALLIVIYNFAFPRNPLPSPEPQPVAEA